MLEDEALREGIKRYSNWPTIPQLYIAGEFIGGSDIMWDMYNSGELQKLLKTVSPPSSPEVSTSSSLADTESMESSMHMKLEKIIKENKVVLFIKGTEAYPEW